MFAPLKPLSRRLMSGLALAMAFIAVSSAKAEPFKEEIPVTLMENIARSAEEAKAGEQMWTLYQGRLARGNGKGKTPAVAWVTIPAAGTYYVWVHHQTHPIRRKSFTVKIGDNPLLYFAWAPFGETPESRPEIYAGAVPDKGGMVWSREAIDLKAGTFELQLDAVPKREGHTFVGTPHPPAVSSLIISNDPQFTPNK